MINQDKMRALAAIFRRRSSPQVQSNPWLREDYTKAADAIDLLLAEVEAAAADKRDAERWRMNIRLMRRKHSANAIAEVVDVVDAALAQRQGEGS